MGKARLNFNLLALSLSHGSNVGKSVSLSSLFGAAWGAGKSTEKLNELNGKDRHGLPKRRTSKRR